MPRRADSLPDDIDALKALLAEQRSKNDDLSRRNGHLAAKVISLQEQLNLALAKRYAASSEKVSPDQIWLFDEAEAEVDVVEHREDEPGDSITVDSYTRKKRGRKPLPETLPRVEIFHDLPETERYCPHDGEPLKEIGSELSEQLDIVPAKIRVLRHVRKKYACECGGCIKTAPLPVQPIPKSLASPGLLAHVAVSKYQDALPLYRQEQILQRIGVDIPRATLANWMIRAGELIQPLINLLRDQLLGYDIVQMDETTVQVLKEVGKAAQSKSYLWVQRGGPPDQRVILYDYDPSRSQTVPTRLLDGFRGYLQTDGYEGYNAVVAAQGLTQIGCWAHARRKFDEAVKAQGKKKQRTGRAWRGLSLIQKLYRVERETKAMTPTQRHLHRQQYAQPILDDIRKWLNEALPQVPPSTATGKALYYLDEQWPKLIRYFEDGRLEMDNNRIENTIRPFVVGRKNWLFSDSVSGVKASANLYSLIETAKANNFEPYGYLRRVFTELPKADTVEAIEALLPANIKDQISAS
jgi:transposase